MSPGSAELERLISRYIDGEASPHERRELERRMDGDPELEALYIQTAALDRELGRAMRTALGRAPVRRRDLRVPWVQLIGLAAAACIGLFFWLNPKDKPAPAGGLAPAPVRASWFAPAQPQADVVQRVNPADVRPQLRLRDTDRDWIIIPGRQRGQFLLIQMDRVRTHAIRLQDDF